MEGNKENRNLNSYGGKYVFVRYVGILKGAAPKTFELFKSTVKLWILVFGLLA